MSVRLLVALVLLTLTVGSCGILGEGDDSQLTVTVVKGIELAPADMGQAQVRSLATWRTRH